MGEKMVKNISLTLNPPEADKGLIPRRLRRYNAFVDTPLLCGGVVHSRELFYCQS